jgi:histone-lysine N-methyltransferase SETD2
VGINLSNKSFTFAFCFLSREKEDDYLWALEQLKTFLLPHKPSVILTNKEPAIMTAIDSVFHETQNILCQWHIDKNRVSL